MPRILDSSGQACNSPGWQPEILIRIKPGGVETAYQRIIANGIGPAAAMIVCSCNAFSDHDIRTALGDPDGPGTVSQIYRHLGHEAHCGRCTRTVREIMREREPGAKESMR